MTEPVTVAVQCACDLFDGVEQFVYNKALPEIIVELNGISHSYAFKKNDEDYRFVIDSTLNPGINFLTLNFKNYQQNYNVGNIRVKDICIFGCTVGFHIFQCEFESYDGSEKNRGHTYIGKPGQWIYPIRSPIIENYRGIVFG